jgi:hypothetical protein
MKVKKVGYLNERNEISGRGSAFLAGILTSLGDETEHTNFKIPFTLDSGPNERIVMLSIPIANDILREQLTRPVNLNTKEIFTLNQGKYRGAFLFKNFLFEAEIEYLEDNAEEKVMLLIKKQVYSEDNELRKLKQEIETIERVISQIGITKRTPIPEVVKLFVWKRDEGKCVRCGSTKDLHFDHIIPVSKGGGSTEENIQILCQSCNLKKSDNITF